MNELSTLRAVVLYVGALLGPGVLLLPGVAAAVAGPASVLAWLALLAMSGLLAWMFSALGTRLSVAGGAAGYVGAAFGPRAERAVAACFVAGALAGAPVVCLIGGGYAAAAIGGGRGTTLLVAAVLLAVIVGLTAAGGRVGAGVQLGLVGVLVVLIVVAVAGALPQAQTSNWTPFASQGWSAVGRSAALLMLAFVGWEAIAPLTNRLRDRTRQLPRVIAIAFAVTACIYLGLAVATIAVLGTRHSTHTPVADLLAVAMGRAGAVAAAVTAVAVTLAAVNAYLSGAGEMVASLRGRPAGTALPLAVGVAGLLVLAAVGAGIVTTEQLIAVPTACFVAVYLGCTVAGVRVLRAAVRAAAGLAFVAVGAVAWFIGPAMAVPVGIAAIAWKVARPASDSVVKEVCNDEIGC